MELTANRVLECEHTDALWKGNFGGFDFSIGKHQVSSAGLLLFLAGRIFCENDKACRLLANKGMSTFDSLQEVDYGGNVPSPVKYWTEINDGSPDRSSDPYNQAQFMG